MHIVMTGATTGLGKVAATQLLRTPGAALTVGARGTEPVAGATMLPLDLASLASVRAFAAALPDVPIDALVLNAGGQRLDPDGRTVDGFETTFAVNHLAHYLLLRLLMPRLAPGARVAITSSGTHDPLKGAEKVGVPPPRHADARLLAHPDVDPGRDASPRAAGMRAYSSSKLCNVMTAMTLSALPEARDGGWIVTAYDPGLTPGTDLARGYPWAVRTLVWPLLTLAAPFAKGMSSLADAGRGLAELATTAAPAPGEVYASMLGGRLTFRDPSVLARNAAARRKLWDDSAALIGLSA